MLYCFYRIIYNASNFIFSLQNYGNTCYLNSVLKAVLSVPNLIDEAKIVLKNKDMSEYPVLEKFSLLCKAMADGKEDYANRRIRDIKTFLGYDKPTFSNNAMQDAEEFLLELLDILEFSLEGLGKLLNLS